MREISLKIQYSALVLKKDDWWGIGVALVGAGWGDKVGALHCALWNPPQQKFLDAVTQTEVDCSIHGANITDFIFTSTGFFFEQHFRNVSGEEKGKKASLTRSTRKW